jgi:hypothetical protein
MEKYLIMDLLTGEYLNDDTYEWVDLKNGSLYEKIEDKYYSPSREMMLPENCEWVLTELT